MMKSEIFRFNLGTLACTIIQDSDRTQPVDDFFRDVPQEERKTVIANSPYNPETVTLSFNVLLIETPQHRILIDSGNGVETGRNGRLLPHLADLNIPLSSIDMVIATHAHADHYIAMMKNNGEKTFPNARYIMWKDEWDFYSSPEWLALDKETNPVRYDLTQRYFLPLHDKLTLIPSNNPQITDNISFIESFGHTKYHVAVKIESGDDSLLYTADTFIQPLHIENPNWKFYDEFDPDLAIISKKKLCKMASDSNMLVLGYHFPFPGLGHIIQSQTGYRWMPEIKS